MKKIIAKLNEEIEMHERRLKIYRQRNDEENIRYFRPFLDGLLFVRDLLEEDRKI